MDYIIKRIDENKAAMEMENGSKVIIIFKKKDNPDIPETGWAVLQQQMLLVQAMEKWIETVQ